MQIIETNVSKFAMAKTGMNSSSAGYSIVTGTWIDWRGACGSSQYNSDASLLTVQDNPCAIKALVPGIMTVWCKGLADSGATDGYLDIYRNGNVVELRQRIEAGSNFVMTGVIECEANQWVQPKCADNFKVSNMIFSCVFMADA